MEMQSKTSYLSCILLNWIGKYNSLHHGHIPYLITLIKICCERSPQCISITDALLSLHTHLMAVCKVCGEAVAIAHRQIIHKTFFGNIDKKRRQTWNTTLPELFSSVPSLFQTSKFSAAEGKIHLFEICPEPKIGTAASSLTECWPLNQSKKTLKWKFTNIEDTYC